MGCEKCHKRSILNRDICIYIFVVYRDSMNVSSITAINLYQSTPGNVHIQGIFAIQMSGPYSYTYVQGQPQMKDQSDVIWGLETATFHSMIR